MPAPMDTTPHRGYHIPNADPQDLVPQIQAMLADIDDDVDTITGGAAAALDDPGSNGIVVRTSVSVTVARTLTGPAAGITVSNGSGVSGNPTLALANDLAALEALSTTGFAKRTGTDTWTAASLVAGDIPDLSATYQPLNAKLTAIGALASAAGLLRNNGSGVFSYDTSTYLTANQTITLSGDVSGSGSTSITTTIGASKVLNSMLAGSIAFSKLLGTDRTLTAGAGLTGGGDLSADRTFTVGAGNGITVNADDVALTTPGTLTVSTSNSSSGNHTHAITSSSNPGAAASILASNSSGDLTLVDLLATGNLWVKDASTGWKSSTSTIITPVTGNTISTTSFSSGLLGWRLYDSGNAEFANVDVRGSIRSSVLLYNAVLATNGSQIVVKSAAKLKSDIAIGASPTYGSTTVTVDVIDQDGLSHAASQLFVVGDVLRLKDGLAGDTWFTTTAVSDQTTFWRYTAVIQAGSNNVTYRAGLGVLDYGMSGAGFIVQTADQTNSPYLQMATHNAAFTVGSSAGTLTVVPQLRIGNLNGFFSSYSSDIYGIAAGQQASGKSWFSLDPTNGFRIGNNTTTSVQIDASGNATFAGSITSTSGTIGGFSLGADYVRDAGNSFGLASTITGGDDVRFWAGDTFANRATAAFRVTEAGAATMTNVTASGAFTLNSGSISGIVNMSGSGGAIAIGSTPPTSASAGTGIWLDRTGLYAVNASSQKVALTSSGLAVLNDGTPYISWGTNVSMSAGANGLTIQSRENTVDQVLTLQALNRTGTPTQSLRMKMTAPNSAASWVRLFDDGSGGSGLAGVTIGADAAPNAMLDVRGDYATTGSIGSTGSRVVKGWFTDLQVTNTIAGSVTGNAAGLSATLVITQGGTNNTSFATTNGIAYYDGSKITNSAFTITSTGIGIGVASPSYPVEIQKAAGSIGITSTTGSNAAYIVWVNTGGGLYVGIDNSAGTSFVSGSSAYATVIGNDSARSLHLATNNNVRLTVSSTGAVRFVTYGVGTITSDASGNLTSVSDITLKEHVRPFTRGLNDLMGLKPIMYGYTKESGLDQTKTDYVGYSAQNVRDFIPEAVGHNPDGKLTLWDRPILDTAISAILQVNRKVDQQEDEIQSLRGTVRSLEAKIASLQKRRR